MDHYKINELSQLSPRTFNTLRNMAIELELNDITTARQLIRLAYSVRPDDPSIKQLCDRIFNPSKSDLKLKKMLASGELAIIPIGFRCHTKMVLRDHFSWVQATLPFDNGFFPPISVANVIKEKKVNLNFDDVNLNHTVCVKDENHHDLVHGKGIKFKKSTYEEIDTYVINRDMDGINQYLDGAYGYYTLDLKNNFILAHYNWHIYSPYQSPQGIYDRSSNLDKINNMLNRRIKRMFHICNAAKFILFVFIKGHYNYMMIDDIYFNLNDLELVKNAVEEAFTTKSFVVNFSEVNSSEKILELLRNY